MALNAYNTEQIQAALMLADLQPVDIDNAQEVEERMNWYLFDYCANSDVAPSISGLALALGVHRKTLWGWKCGQRRKNTHQKIIQKAYNFVTAGLEQRLLESETTPVSLIFLLKNNFGYDEKKEVTISTKQMYELEEMATPEELEEKYLALTE